MTDVVVIGAGLAGTLAAIELSKDYDVVLIEAGEEIIPSTSSSYNECYKLHTGVHYIGDEKTAEHCLKKAVEFARRFPNHIAGGNNLFSPWRRGRHYIMKNSMVSKEDAIKIARHIQQTYLTLVTEDPENKVFGDPKDFIKFLEKDDYSYISDSIPYYDQNENKTYTSVELGIETAESQIDIYSLKDHLKKEISKNPRIKLITSSRVKNISYCSDKLGHDVSYTKNDELHETQSKMIVNCAWQNIEVLDSKIGAYVPDPNRVNRIKVSVLVKLPDELKKMNTCIFSSGPYCSITVLQNGKAILTSERITNIGFYKAGNANPPEDLLQLLNNELSLAHPKGKTVAQNILSDCASYLNEPQQSLMEKAQIEEIHVGFVKLINTKKEYSQDSIHDRDSAIHSRQDDGVEPKGLGYVSNSGMKMTYAAGNANKVKNIIDIDFELLNKLTRVISRVKDLLPHDFLTRQKHKIDPLLNITYRERIIELLTTNNHKVTRGLCKRITNEIVSSLVRREKLHTEFFKPLKESLNSDGVDNCNKIKPR